jgi:hypothetical protein
MDNWNLWLIQILDDEISYLLDQKHVNYRDEKVTM